MRKSLIYLEQVHHIKAEICHTIVKSKSKVKVKSNTCKNRSCLNEEKEKKKEVKKNAPTKIFAMK